MLVLTRRCGERLIIRHHGLPGGEIVLSVAEILTSPRRVKLGISADRSVVVLREEIDGTERAQPKR